MFPFLGSLPQTTNLVVCICEGGKLPNALVVYPKTQTTKYQIQTTKTTNSFLGGGELPKTIEHMSEMKFAYIFHKSCINCKNWSCTSSC